MIKDVPVQVTSNSTGCPNRKPYWKVAQTIATIVTLVKIECDVTAIASLSLLQTSVTVPEAEERATKRHLMKPYRRRHSSASAPSSSIPIATAQLLLTTYLLVDSSVVE